MRVSIPLRLRSATQSASCIPGPRYRVPGWDAPVALLRLFRTWQRARLPGGGGPAGLYGRLNAQRRRAASSTSVTLVDHPCAERPGLDQVQRDLFRDRRQEGGATADHDRMAEHAQLVDEVELDRSLGQAGATDSRSRRRSEPSFRPQPGAEDRRAQPLCDDLELDRGVRRDFRGFERVVPATAAVAARVAQGDRARPVRKSTARTTRCRAQAFFAEESLPWICLFAEWRVSWSCRCAVGRRLVAGHADGGDSEAGDGADEEGLLMLTPFRDRAVAAT